jgi:proteasome lid subunit RPN8/RPN11
MTRPLYLPGAVWNAVQTHARDAAPDECVGLLFGNAHRVARAVPLANLSPTPRTRFFADPQGLFAAFQAADARAEALLAIYHSHPGGEACPSPTDVAEACYDVITLIVTPCATRAFRIEGGAVVEVGLEFGR